MDATELKTLPRKKIQDLAKKYGVKANMKTEEMVKQLLAKHPRGVPRANQDDPQRTQKEYTQVRTIQRRRSRRLETAGQSENTQSGAQPQPVVVASHAHDRSSASIVYDEERSFDPEASSLIQKPGPSTTFSPIEEDNDFGTSHLPIERPGSASTSGSASRSGRFITQEVVHNEEQSLDRASSSSTQANSPPRPLVFKNRAVPFDSPRPQCGSQKDSTSRGNSPISPEVPFEDQAVKFLDSIAASAPVAGPSRLPSVKLTPNRLHVITEDPNNAQTRIFPRVFFPPGDPDRPSARGRRHDPPRIKEVRSLQRKCAEIMDEEDKMSAEIADVGRLMHLARHRLDAAQKKLSEVRPIRLAIERRYLAKLKQDQSLHDGSGKWTQPIAEVERAELQIPTPTSDSEDSDSSSIIQIEEEETSPLTAASLGKRTRGIDEDDEEEQEQEGKDPFAAVAFKRMRS